MQNVCVTIQTIDDMIVAPSKTFTVNLYPSDSLVAVGDRAFGTSVVVTIINIDSKALAHIFPCKCKNTYVMY